MKGFVVLLRGRTALLSALFAAALVAWVSQENQGTRSGESELGEFGLLYNVRPETRAEKQSLALEAVGRILQHHQPSAEPKHPLKWPGISFFAKQREEAWEQEREAEKHNAMQQELREQAPTGPNGQKLSPGQAALAAKFDRLAGIKKHTYSNFEQQYEHETGHRLHSHSSSPKGDLKWGTTWDSSRSSPKRQRSEALERLSRRHEYAHRGFQQSLEGETGESPAPDAGNVGDSQSAAVAPAEDGSKEMVLEAEVEELKKKLNEMEGQVAEVRHGYEGGMHVEGGDPNHGYIWDGENRRAVSPSGSEHDSGEAHAEGGGVAMGAPGEKDFDKYGVELDKFKDPKPLHYRDDIASGDVVHTREDEIKKIQEYQTKIAEEQHKMREDWEKVMASPPEVTDATRPDIMDPDSFPTEGAAFRAKYTEMKDFKAAVEAFASDPEFNPMIVLKAHHLVKYGIPAPESDSIDVWRQWYREALDKYHVIRHEVTDMASGNWHDYDTDYEMHGLHRPGAYKKVWRTRDAWAPPKPHAPLVESPDANYTLVEGGGVAQQAPGGEIHGETAAAEAEPEASASEQTAPATEAEGTEVAAAEGAARAEGGSAEGSGAPQGAGEAAVAEGAGAPEVGAEGGSVQGTAAEKAPVVVVELAHKVDSIEKKLDSVVNLLEASRGLAPATLRAHQQQQQQRATNILAAPPGFGRHARQGEGFRKAYLPSAAERDRLAHAEDRRRGGGAATAAGVGGGVSALAAAREKGVAPEQLRAIATAAAMATLKSDDAKGTSPAEERILSHPPKAVLNWLATAFQAADKTSSGPALKASNTQRLVSVEAATAAAAPTAAAGPGVAVGKAVAGYSMKVPAGLVPGQQFLARIPGGGEVMVTVPAHASAGELIAIAPQGATPAMQAAAGAAGAAVSDAVSVISGGTLAIKASAVSPAAAATAARGSDAHSAAPAAARKGKVVVPQAVEEMIKRGTWESGERVSTPPRAHSKGGPPLYTAVDAKKDALAQAMAKAAITDAEKVNAADTVVHSKTASKSVLQTGPDPSLKPSDPLARADPLKRVTKAILVDGGSAEAKAAEAVKRKGDVDPEGKQEAATPIGKVLTKRFIGGRTMYLPKYDKSKTSGDGWGWLW